MNTYTHSLLEKHTTEEVNSIATALRKKYLHEASKNQVWLSDLKQYESLPAEEYNKKFDEYVEQREVHDAYFDLYLVTSDLSRCKRRSRKMKKELLSAVSNAEKLDLKVY
jgi:ribosomal protein L22